MLNVPLMLPENDEQIKIYIDDIKACGAKRVFIDVLDVFCEGEEREKIFSNLKKSIAAFEAIGVEVGVWTTTLGYGDPRDEHFHRRFGNTARITAFSGKSGTAVCTLDDEFAQEMERKMIEIAKTGAKLILLDDELVLSVRPGFTCSCEKHLAKFAEVTGVKMTREEVRDLFTGKPSELRTKWMDVTGDSILDFCRRMRKAVDSVDPKIRMGICASYTHYDLDGFDVRDCVKILAGEGNQPFFRFSGATYWPVHAPRLDGQTLSDIFETSRMQCGWLEGEDLELLDENDPYPRLREVVPASYVELYDKVMLAEGKSERLKYILLHGADKIEGETAYLDEHMNNMQYDEIIQRFFADKVPCGYRVYEAEKKIRDAVLPDEYMGDKDLMSAFTQPRAGIIVSGNSIPTCYTGNGVGIVFGENARHIDSDVIGAGLVLDIGAAKILTERGVDVGLVSCEKMKFDTEIDENGVLCNFSEPNTYKVCVKSDAKALTWFLCGDEKAPGSWYYENADGQKFVVLSIDGISASYVRCQGSYTISRFRQRLLRKAYKLISGDDLPAYVEKAPQMYVLTSKNVENTEMAVLLCNIYPDTVREPKIELDGEYEVEESLHCDAKTEGKTLKLCGIAPYNYAAVLLKKK